MIFTSNCAACHSGGLNAVVQQKTLKADALKTYEKDSIEAIVNQVANGQGAMPKFANLSEEDKIDVAAYVLDQAKKEWK